MICIECLRAAKSAPYNLATCEKTRPCTNRASPPRQQNAVLVWQKSLFSATKVALCTQENGTLETCRAAHTQRNAVIAQKTRFSETCRSSCSRHGKAALHTLQSVTCSAGRLSTALQRLLTSSQTPRCHFNIALPAFSAPPTSSLRLSFLPYPMVYVTARETRQCLAVE